MTTAALSSAEKMNKENEDGDWVQLSGGGETQICFTLNCGAPAIRGETRCLACKEEEELFQAAKLGKWTRSLAGDDTEEEDEEQKPSPPLTTTPRPKLIEQQGDESWQRKVDRVANTPEEPRPPHVGALLRPTRRSSSLGGGAG